MREQFLSNCEKTFVQKAITEGYRLDGRNYDESRKLEISFGADYGSCLVSLGESKVLSQVSCEVVQPKQIRPNEGVLFINVDTSPMTAPQFDYNRQSDLCVYLNRLLEKCYKDSKCIDLESLCIVVEEKVWSLRVDIKVINHAGNVIECASIATLTSLAHFKRPDITRTGDEIHIHTMAEKDPIPTVLYHYPICLTFAIFNNDILISDPTFSEESVCASTTDEGCTTGGLLVIGMNQYKELCLMDLTGAAIYNSNIVHRATLSAAKRCQEIVQLIKTCIASDDNLRQKRNKINFKSNITDNHVLALSTQEPSIQLKNYNDDDFVEAMEEGLDIGDDGGLNVDENKGDGGWTTVKQKNKKESKYDVKSQKGPVVETQVKSGQSSWLEVSSDSDG